MNIECVVLYVIEEVAVNGIAEVRCMLEHVVMSWDSTRAETWTVMEVLREETGFSRDGGNGKANGIKSESTSAKIVSRALGSSQRLHTPTAPQNDVSKGNNAGALTGMIGAAASTDPTGLGAIVAVRMAEKQLKKIRNSTTEDVKAMSLDEGTLEIIDSRISVLGNQR
jgi:hypothetical protein